MNPFEAAAGEQQLQCDGGAPLQPPQRGPHGRLASSSTEVELSDSGDAAGNGGGRLSPSVSAMATVSIRSNSGPPAPGGAGWSQHGKGGSFLVPGYALPNGRSAGPPAIGTMSPASPVEGGQHTAAAHLPGQLMDQPRAPPDERLAATAPVDGPAPMDVGPAANAPAAESDEAEALETLAAMGRAASAFGSQGSAFRAVPPRRTFSGPVTLPEQTAHPARLHSHLAGPGLKTSPDSNEAGGAAERRSLAVTFGGKKVVTQRVSPDGSPSFSAQHEPTGSSRSSGDNGNNVAPIKRERSRLLPPLPEDSAGGGSGAATGTGYTASRASYRKRSVTSPASGGMPAEFEAARQGLAPPVKRNRPEARAPAPAMPAMPQTAGGAAQSDAPAVDDAGMTPATHARMAAYAAMVYNANRPPGYPALAVVPDSASALAEQINSVVACTQTHISPPSEATLATASKFHRFMATNSPQLSGHAVARSPPPKAERTTRRASTPARLAAAAQAAAVSAPPLANGQAVFGAASQALLGGGLLDGSMLQQGTVPAMTPEMAAALQELLLQRGGMGLLQAQADGAATPAALSAAAHGPHTNGGTFTMPTDSAPQGMAPQLLADGIRVRSNSLGPFGRSSQQQPQAQARAPTPSPPSAQPAHPWTGPFLSGPPSMSSAGVAAAVTEAMAANGVTNMLDGATAKAFLAALASQAGGNGSSEGHHFAAAPHMTLS